MKRLNFLKLLVFFGALFIFYKCADSPTSDAVDSNLSNKEFLSKLSSFNKSKGANNSNLISKKKGSSSIASADASGALFGAQMGSYFGPVGAAVFGIAGGAISSHDSYCQGKKCGGKSNKIVGKSVVFDFPSDFDYLENLGVLHNDALQNIYLSGDNNVSLENWIENNFPENSELIVQNQSFINMMNKVESDAAGYVESDYDFKKLMDKYENEAIIDGTVKHTLLLYNDVIKNTESFEDFETITRYYVDEVANSSLSNNQKRQLFSFFAVSIQSYYYWINYTEES